MELQADPGMTRRREIALAVADVILNRGLTDLSLRTIAGEIGTSHRMLLYHFGSKEKLLVAAFDIT